ncbi:MAG: methylmalonyl-CoA mutase subunit beta [Hyphomicrobiales bacterium]|nr:methylmalonyl-CoA mutase subunit beta [Hyphomicrobiales bacterium]
MADTRLTNPFSPGDEAAWRAAAIRALKGADFEKKLVSRSADGIAIQPLYPRKPGAALVAGASAGARWRIMQRVDHPHPDQASELALADLGGGADGLALVFHGSAGARGFGLPTTNAATLDAALVGVELDLVDIRLEPSPQARITGRLFAEMVKRRKLASADLKVDFGIDLIGLLARSGVWMAPWADIAKRLADMRAEFAGHGFNGPFFSCDSRLVHEAGGSEAQELAWALATALCHVRALEAGGVPLDKALAALSFILAIDADQFIGIAKLRALRLLMNRMQEACRLDPQPVVLHAETAWRMLTRTESPVNMLRNAIAAFSAGVGGADSVAVLPHTAARGLGDGFARRIARNTQAVLMEESHLWRVVDPAAGAGGFEALTDQLCERAWAEFQQIEREGGIVTSLQAGALQARIAVVKARRDKDLAAGRMPLTGTSAFPNLAERGEAVLDIAPAAPRAIASGPVTIAPLASHRLSEGFEALRERADGLRQSGRPPRLFVAVLGRASDVAARIGFTRGFFEAGGIETIVSDGFAEADGSTDLVALTDAYKASAAAIACLCGTDESYAAEGTDAAMALAVSGANSLWLAGRPGELEAGLRAAGANGFIFAGCDMLNALKEALDVLAA